MPTPPSTLAKPPSTMDNHKLRISATRLIDDAEEFDDAAYFRWVEAEHQSALYVMCDEERKKIRS